MSDKPREWKLRGTVDGDILATQGPRLDAGKSCDVVEASAYERINQEAMDYSAALTIEKRKSAKLVEALRIMANSDNGQCLAGYLCQDLAKQALAEYESIGSPTESSDTRLRKALEQIKTEAFNFQEKWAEKFGNNPLIGWATCIEEIATKALSPTIKSEPSEFGKSLAKKFFEPGDET